MGESSKRIRQLAEELGVSENNLYNWRKQFSEKADKVFSNKPRLDEKELEIQRLKARISELENVMTKIVT
jgi:transposase